VACREIVDDRHGGRHMTANFAKKHAYFTDARRAGRCIPLPSRFSRLQFSVVCGAVQPVDFQVTVLEVLVSYPDGFACLDDLKRDMTTSARCKASATTAARASRG
jgi:hypothetical protein